MHGLSTIRNDEVSDLLERAAHLLDAQGADGYRVRAYRHAAQVVRSLERSVAEVARSQGREGLDAIPGVGPRIASAIDEIVHTGRWAMLDRLLGEVTAENVLTLVPGIGPRLAARIHEQLDIDTLEALELAAHDGRLEALPGFGHRRVLGVREALASMLSRSGRARARRIALATTGRDSAPPVALLLEVDAEYRRRAAANTLPKIRPRRFNPRREAWLPVLHLDRDGYAFTALYSNTARAHQLGRSRDWVVIYFERDGDEGQCTVVTERSGALAGQRVVRGRPAHAPATAVPALGPGRSL